jgi:hypothetical protein
VSYQSAALNRLVNLGVLQAGTTVGPNGKVFVAEDVIRELSGV